MSAWDCELSALSNSSLFSDVTFGEQLPDQKRDFEQTKSQLSQFLDNK
jgi:hypothetical protein